MGQTFRELTVWKRAMELTLAVYRLSQEFPREEQFGLTSQIRRDLEYILPRIDPNNQDYPDFPTLADDTGRCVSNLRDIEDISDRVPDIDELEKSSNSIVSNLKEIENSPVDVNS